VPAVSVIVPARNAQTTLPATLAAVARQRDVEDVEVIVVDDGSTDGTARAARRAPGDVLVLAGHGQGPAVSRNLGASSARAPALAFLDADCEPAEGWLAAGLRALEHADLVLGAVAPPPGARVGPYDRTLTVGRASPLFETANMFVTRELFERIGGFESWLRPRRGIELGEDVWFGWRARRADARITFCPEALVHHAVIPRGARGYIAERARLRFFPPLARRIPELREAFFYRRYFMMRRSALFDLGLAGVAVALGSRRALPLIATVPYIRELVHDARRWGRRRAPAIALVRVAGDVVGAGALIAGSIAARTPLL